MRAFAFRLQLMQKKKTKNKTKVFQKSKLIFRQGIFSCRYEVTVFFNFSAIVYLKMRIQFTFRFHFGRQTGMMLQTNMKMYTSRLVFRAEKESCFSIDCWRACIRQKSTSGSLPARTVFQSTFPVTFQEHSLTHPTEKTEKKKLETPTTRIKLFQDLVLKSKANRSGNRSISFKT